MSERIKRAIIAFLEQQIWDLQHGVPIKDFYVSRADTYRFDVTTDEAEKFARR